MKVLLFATLREMAGQREIEIPLAEPRQLISCLNELAVKFGTEWRNTVLCNERSISDYVSIYINGQGVDKKSGDVMVSDKDEVEILVPLAGG